MSDIAHSVKVAKSDDARQNVFGWAMVAIRKDGATVIDHQGDWIALEELEDTAYDFVVNVDGPASGEEHDGDYVPDGLLIESVVFTPEKLEGMGLEPGSVDYGHWIGLHIPDKAAYERVKNGDKAMLSIEGTADRVDGMPTGLYAEAT